MQSTIYFIHKYLSENYSVHFICCNKNNNRIDPVINLKKEDYVKNQIIKKIKKLKFDTIIINTTKLAFIYLDLLKKIDSKKIIVSHDLYNFRKKYFKKINVIDKTPLSKKNELKTINDINFICDLTPQEINFLKTNKVNKKKIFNFNTPADLPLFKNKSKKIYDFLYIKSNWVQNDLAYKKIKKIAKVLHKKNFLILSSGKPKVINNITYKKYNKNFISNAKVGLAPILSGTGRNVKIIDMLSGGIPIITNKIINQINLNTSNHALVVSFKNVRKICKFLSHNHQKKFNKLGKNNLSWFMRHSYYKNSLKIFKRYINI